MAELHLHQTFGFLHFLPDIKKFLEKDVFCLVASMGQRHVPCLRQNKNIFFYFFTKLKTYHLSYSIYVGFIVEKNAFSLSKFCTSFLPKTPGSAPASDRLVPYL